jgi:hypothetical protein
MHLLKRLVTSCLPILVGTIALVTPPEVIAAQPAPLPPAQNVNVVNTPLPVTGTISVGNLGDNPLPIVDVDNAARGAFQTVLGQVGSFEVPAGKRLVIEYLSGRINVNAGCTVAIGVRTQLQNQSAVEHFIPVTPGFGAVLLFSQRTRLYADGTASILTEQGGGCTSVSVSTSISGYLVDMP